MSHAQKERNSHRRVAFLSCIGGGFRGMGAMMGGGGRAVRNFVEDFGNVLGGWSAQTLE